MTNYTTDELISSSKLAKNFWWYISKINNNEIEKIWVLKNNKLDAVIISVETYDLFSNFLEDLEIYNSIKNRMNKSDFVEANSVLNKFNLSI